MVLVWILLVLSTRYLAMLWAGNILTTVSVDGELWKKGESQSKLQTSHAFSI